MAHGVSAIGGTRRTVEDGGRLAGTPSERPAINVVAEAFRATPTEPLGCRIELGVTESRFYDHLL